METKNSRWLLTLNRYIKEFSKPAITKHKGITSVNYLVRVKKKLLYFNFISKDGFRTVEYFTLGKFGSRKVLTGKIGKPVTKADFLRIVKLAKKHKISLNNIDKIKPFSESTISNQLLSEANILNKLKQINWYYLIVSSYYILIAVFFIASLAVWLKALYSDKVNVNRELGNINDKLFKMQTGEEPEFKVYETLISMVSKLTTHPYMNGLIVCGPPGTGKTYVIQRTLYFSNTKYVLMKGSGLDLFSFYNMLWKYKNKLLVLDDFDVEWTTELVGLIKAATDTSKKRVISLPAHKLTQSSTELSDTPERFIYEGKIIFVTNKSKQEIPSAVRSRCPTIVVSFKIDEMIKIINSMLKYIMPDVPYNIKKEVFDYLVQLRNRNMLERIDFRTIENAIQIRLIFEDNWKKIIMESLV